MTYFEHKLRLFCSKSEESSCKDCLQLNRIEGRLKTYSSATDLRSWSLDAHERRKQLLSLMNCSPKSEKSEWKYVSFCAVISQMFSFNERQVCNLENMINELMNVLKNALPQLEFGARNESQQMLDNFRTKYHSCLRYFRQPLDIVGWLCPSESEKSVYTGTEYSEGSTCMNRTVEEDIKALLNCKEEGDAWNKMSQETLAFTDSDAEDSECNIVATIDASPDQTILKQTEEKLKELQEDSKADKEKISKLERLLCAANCTVKRLTREKNVLKLKLSHHESCCCSCSSEEEALKKIYITENCRMREELEGLEQLCWRIKQILQWVIKERDCYRRRCTKLQYLAHEIDDLKCEMEAWRFTEQERCRLEKVVDHLKHVLKKQDRQLKHLLCHIELLSQRNGEFRSKSCDDLTCPVQSQESLCVFRHNNMLCLPSTSKDVLAATEECTDLNPCSRKPARQRAMNTINSLLSQRHKPRSIIFLH